MKTCFYPSGGNRHGWIMNSPLFEPYDFFILSDYRPRNLRERNSFWRRFVKSAAPLKVTTIRSTPISRTFITSNEKVGVYFFLDNSKILDRIRLAGHSIDCMIGYICGCMGEGGGTYCVNRSPFLNSVLSLMPENGELRYVTDHGMMFPDEGWGDAYNYPMSFRFGVDLYEFSHTSNKVQGLSRAHEFTVRKVGQVNKNRRTNPQNPIFS